MELFSLSFLFIFLPVSLFLYYLTPNKLKAHCIVLISCFYSASVFGGNIILLLGIVLCDYLVGLQIHINRKKALLSRLLVFLNIAKSIGIFVYNSLHHSIDGFAIFGLGAIALTSISYTFDIYNQSTRPETDLINFAAYSLFFPKLYFGPFFRYSDIRYQLKETRPSLTVMSKGAVMLCVAFAKKIIIADNISLLYSELSLISGEDLSVLTIWGMVVSYCFALYFNLSAYFDMAQAVGYLFSLNLPQSFHYPFLSKSADEFFARYNITINGFVRKYVYMQLGGKEHGVVSGALNIIIVCVIISQWYAISLNTLAWGIYFAAVILAEKFLFKWLQNALPDFICRVFTFFITICSFVFMLSLSVPQALFNLRAMFGFSTLPLSNDETLYYLSLSLPLLLLCVFLCGNLYAITDKWMGKAYPLAWEIFNVVLSVSMLSLSIVFML